MKQARRAGRARRESRKKKLRRKRAAQALAAGAAIAGGTQAYAVPVAHVNPPGAGHFEWPSASPNEVDMQWLDLALSAQQQPPVGAAYGPTRISQVPSVYGFVGAPSGIVQTQVGGQLGYPIDLLGVSGGTPIPTPGAGWNGTDYGAYLSYPGYESTIPEGATTYLGLRFNGPGYQYGWIQVQRSGDSLDALAWGYETDPGVPVAAGAGIPEPGTLAMLAVGAATMAGRRRRSAE